MSAAPRRLAQVACAAALVTAWGCASHPARVRVLPPVSAGSAGGSVAAAGSAIAQTAEALLGAPYREGGTLPDGFDCSGLVSYVFARNGIAMPRDVRRQASAGVEVPRGVLQAGDLVFFSTTGSGPTHVGIALGDGRFVHAPKSGGVVRTESLASAYWAERFVTARRIVSATPPEVPFQRPG